MVQFLRVKNLAYCEFNRLSAFLPAWEISRERRLCLNVRSTQKCQTEDHQSSWPDSGKLLRHQYGISVVESCETSQAARRREGCIRRLHSFRALRVKPDREPVVISCTESWSRDQIMQFQSLSFCPGRQRNWETGNEFVFCPTRRGSWRTVLKMFTTLFRFRKVKAARKG